MVGKRFLGALSIAEAVNTTLRGEVTKGLLREGGIALIEYGNPAGWGYVAVYTIMQYVGVRFEDVPTYINNISEGYNWLAKHPGETQAALDKFWLGGLAKGLFPESADLTPRTTTSKSPPATARGAGF